MCKWILLAIAALVVQADLARAEWFVEGYGGYSVQNDFPLRRTITEGLTLGSGHHDHNGHDDDDDHDHDDDHNGHAKAHDLTKNLGMVNRILAGVRFGQWADSAPWLGMAVEGLYQRASFRRQAAQEREIEVEHGHHPEIDSHEVLVGPGRAGIYGGFVNVMVRYPGFWLQPYGGAGIGALHASLSDGGFGGLSTTNFAWQAFAGVKVMATERLALFAEYKWIGADFWQSSPTRSAGADFRSGNVVAGVSWHFR